MLTDKNAMSVDKIAEQFMEDEAATQTPLKIEPLSSSNRFRPYAEFIAEDVLNVQFQWDHETYPVNSGESGPLQTTVVGGLERLLNKSSFKLTKEPQYDSKDGVVTLSFVKMSK